jgi:hypothetical protein
MQASPFTRHVRLCGIAVFLSVIPLLCSSSLRAQETVLPTVEVTGRAQGAVTQDSSEEKAVLESTPGGVNLIAPQKTMNPHPSGE